MASTRFTRSRLVSVTSNGGTYIHDYALADGKELLIIELFVSSDADGQKIEILYSDDNGSTWTNPFDSGSDRLLTAFIAGYIPASGKPEATWITGSSTTILRIKITNNHPTQNSNVYWLVKAWERDV